MTMEEIGKIVNEKIQARQSMIQKLEIMMMLSDNDPNYLAFLAMSKVLFNISIATLRHGEEMYCLMESFRRIKDPRTLFDIGSVIQIVKLLTETGLAVEKELDRAWAKLEEKTKEVWNAANG